MSHEHLRSESKYEVEAVRDAVQQSMAELFRSRGINLGTVLAHNRHVEVTLDHFYTDDTIGMTPEPVAAFLDQVYLGRAVALEMLTVHLFNNEAGHRSPHSVTSRSTSIVGSVALSTRPLQSWQVELDNASHSNMWGIIVLDQGVVVSNKTTLFLSETGLTYTTNVYPLAQWLENPHEMEVQERQGQVQRDVMYAIAALLPDHPVGIYIRHLDRHGKQQEPDLLLPNPIKAITII